MAPLKIGHPAGAESGEDIGLFDTVIGEADSRAIFELRWRVTLSGSETVTAGRIAPGLEDGMSKVAFITGASRGTMARYNRTMSAGSIS